MTLSKPIIGVMGAIASGKSFVSSIFKEFGFAVIDADQIVKELYSDRRFVENNLVPIFGEKVADDKEGVNRRLISDVVFSNAQKRARLNSVVHPAVAERLEQLLSLYMEDKSVKGIVLDVPLLLEAGLDKKCDFLIFVEADTAICRQRAAQRDGISIKELEKRQNSQIFLDKKKNIANYTINNNTKTSAVRKQVGGVISDIFREFNGK